MGISPSNLQVLSSKLKGIVNSISELVRGPGSDVRVSETIDVDATRRPADTLAREMIAERVLFVNERIARAQSAVS
jgi:hypothetical protein